MRYMNQGAREYSPPRTTGVYWLSLSLSLFLALCCLSPLPGCHEVTPTPGPDDTPQAVEPARSPEPLPSHVAIDVETDDSDRWLFVEAIKNNAAGGWATGSFNPEHNKIDIRTRDVQAFAIDVARLPILWDRFVILSINERRSELRRRDHALLHFALDDYGEWVVVEP